MDNVQTIDTIVKDVSLPRKMWNKGKYALIALVAAYALNGGYHLVHAAVKQGELEEERFIIELKAVKYISYFNGLQDSGMSDEERQKKFDEKLKELTDNDKRPEIKAQRNYHLHSALNPFYH